MGCVFRESETSDYSVVVGLKDVFTEVHLPYPQDLVLSTSDAEAGAHHQAADGGVIVQFVDLLELVSGVVDLEQKAVLAAHVHSLNLGALLKGIRIVVGVFEVQNSEDSVSGVVV